jgi:hypothetical protein
MIEIGTKTLLEVRKHCLLGFRQQNLSSSSCISMDDLSTNSSGGRSRSSSSSNDNGALRRSVAFDSIEILEFPIELGDNPSVRGNCIEVHTVQKGRRVYSRFAFLVLFSLHVTLFCWMCSQVHEGPPIQIGWKHHNRNVMELDVYEVFRTRRRGRRELPISRNARTAT